MWNGSCQNGRGGVILARGGRHVCRVGSGDLRRERGLARGMYRGGTTLEYTLARRGQAAARGGRTLDESEEGDVCIEWGGANFSSMREGWTNFSMRGGRTLVGFVTSLRYQQFQHCTHSYSNYNLDRHFTLMRSFMWDGVTLHHTTMGGAKPVFSDLCPTFVTHFGSHAKISWRGPFFGHKWGTSGDREVPIHDACSNSCNTSTYNMHTNNMNTSTHKLLHDHTQVTWRQAHISNMNTQREHKHA